MSEEEKNAIEELKKILDEYEKLDYRFENMLDVEQTNAIYKTLNLIEKQQKEIEELKKEKYIYNVETNTISKIPIDNNYIPKQKIKDKIEKNQKKIDKLENKKTWNEPNDTIRYDTLLKYNIALKELLESFENLCELECDYYDEELDLIEQRICRFEEISTIIEKQQKEIEQLRTELNSLKSIEQEQVIDEMCEYCEKGKGICKENRKELGIELHSAISKLIAYGIDINKWDISVGCKINFCPMCGRKLENLLESEE